MWVGNTRERVVLGALLALAFAVRLGIILTAATPHFGDSFEYIAGATRLLDGQPLAMKNEYFFVRAPGYSLFIALVWTLTGTRSLLVVTLAQALLGVATCYYVYALARRLSPTPVAAFVALAAAALYPYHLFFSTSLGAEILAMFFLVAAAFHLVRGLGHPPDYRQVLLGGTLLALANLTRPNFTLVLPLFGLWLAWYYWRNKRAMIAVGSIVLFATLAISLPWTLACYRQGLGFIFLTDGGGANYFIGHSDNAARLYCADISDEERRDRYHFGDLDRFSKLPEYALAKTKPPALQDDVFFDAGRAWDQRNPDKLLCLAFNKLVHYWRPFVSPIAYGRTTVIASLASGPLLGFGWIGLILAFRRGERVLTCFALANAIASTLSAVLIHATIRYRPPIIDLLWLPFFGYAVADLVARFHHARARRLASSV